MAVLYPGTSVSGYNANPPPDDGTTVSTNQITWNSTIKAKIGDPLNTFASSVDSNITSAFGKTLDGATIVTTAVSYAAGAADQGRLIKVTASGQTVTTPDASATGAPFVFAVNNQSTGTITLAGNSNGAQTVDGSTTQTIQSGGSCIVKTDGTNWFTIGLKPAANALAGNNYGFDSAINLNLQCSVATNLLTVAVKTKAGNDPSASDPVLIPFRDTTLTTGDPVWVTLTAALSINTNATGATLGSQSSKPFRFWIVAFNNAGTLALALWHSGAGASSIAINPLNEGTLQSTTGISGGATSVGTFYTPNGTTLTSKAFRILGYLEYVSGLTTAGTYAAAPDIVQLFGPGIKKPGDVVQMVYATSGSQTSQTSATKTAMSPTAAITPSAAANIIFARATAVAQNNSSPGANTFQLGRTSNSNLFGSLQTVNGVANQISSVFSEGLDAPNTTSSTNYNAYVSGNGSNATLFGGTIGTIATVTTLTLQELMA